MITDQDISAVQEDYLEAILALEADHGRARVRDLAERLSVHKSTVTAALKVLADKALVEHEPYGRIVMTDAGRLAAERVTKDHSALKAFLKDVLLFDATVAEENACRMEHVMDRAVINRLVAFASFVKDQGHKTKGLQTQFQSFLEGNKR